MRSIFRIHLIVCLFVAFGVIPSSAAEARQLSVVFDVIEDGQHRYGAALADASWTTKLALNRAGRVEIASDEDIYFLYVVWDRVPGPWLLTEDLEVHTRGKLCGRNGFLHEYVALDAPSKSVTLKAPAGGCVLCDVFCYGEGEVPSNVQVWQPFCSDADMLLLSTHADDEHLFFGGIMPTYAGELGYKVQIAYLTHHWEQPVRPHELLNGLWTVGMTNYPVIPTFTDYYSDNLEHAKTLWDLDEVEAYEVMLLRRFKPEVVVQDINGEYGHGAHMLGAWVMQQAIDWAADSAWRDGEAAAPGSYLEAVQKLPAFRTSKVYMHLWKENAVQMNWDKPLARFGGKTAFEMAKAGFACHASQQQWFQMDRTGVFDCAAFGLYDTTVGSDTQLDDPDLFENLNEEDFSDHEAPQEEETAPQQEEEETASCGMAETPAEDAKGRPRKSLSGGLYIAAGAALCLIAIVRMRRRNQFKGRQE